MRTPSVTVGVSALVHLAAIGALLALRPAPFPDPEPNVETVEVSIEYEPAAERPAKISATPSSSPIRADVTTASPPLDGLGSVDTQPSFDLPALPTFKSRTPSPKLDTLGAVLDCVTGEGLGREASRHPMRARPPCAHADLPLRVPMAKLPADVSEPNGDTFRTGDDYRTFKTIRPMFDETLFPEKVPQANRALKKWLSGLFR